MIPRSVQFFVVVCGLLALFRLHLDSQAQPVEIVPGNVINAGFYATGDVWCFQSPACQHLGTNYGAAPGTAVFAPLAFTVTQVGAYTDPAREGQYIVGILDDRRELYMGHLAGVSVAVGQRVETGQVIGTTNHLAHTHIQLTDLNGSLMDFDAYWGQR